VQLEHSFSVPVGIDEAWPILIDIERIGPCMPGAAIDSVDGDEFTGTVKVKLGPINLTYKGKAAFLEKDAESHRAVIDARGRDARGNGTASAKITATLHEEGTGTLVKVITDLDITGKPAQFGRGVMVDVGNKLLGQFADTLAKTLKGPEATATVAAGDAEPVAAAAAASGDAPSDEAAGDEAAGGGAGGGAGANGAAPKKAAATKTAAAAKSAPAKAAPAKRTRPKPPGKAAAEPAPDGPEAAAETPAETDVASAQENVAPAEENAGSGASAAAAATASAVGRAAVPDPEPGLLREPASPAPARRSADDVEPIDLLHHAGPAVAKRLAPVAVALVVVLIAVRRRRHKG
jgi:carbon monoxide dehydrogenase subunit G